MRRIAEMVLDAHQLGGMAGDGVHLILRGTAVFQCKGNVLAHGQPDELARPGPAAPVPTWAESSKMLLWGASTPSTVRVPVHAPGLENGFSPLMHPASVLLPLPEGPQ